LIEEGEDWNEALVAVGRITLTLACTGSEMWRRIPVARRAIS
jgi:hypothetical protein